MARLRKDDTLRGKAARSLTVWFARRWFRPPTDLLSRCRGTLMRSRSAARTPGRSAKSREEPLPPSAARYSSLKSALGRRCHRLLGRTRTHSRDRGPPNGKRAPLAFGGRLSEPARTVAPRARAEAAVFKAQERRGSRRRRAGPPTRWGCASTAVWGPASHRCRRGATGFRSWTIEYPGGDPLSTRANSTGRTPSSYCPGCPGSARQSGRALSWRPK